MLGPDKAMTTQELLRQWRDEKEWKREPFDDGVDLIYGNGCRAMGVPIDGWLGHAVDQHNSTLARALLLAELLEMTPPSLNQATFNLVEQRLTETAKGEQ